MDGIRAPDPAVRRFARFDRRFFDGRESFTLVGSGDVGGKAHGLAFVRDTIAAAIEPADFPAVTVSIPTLTVLGTDAFDTFLADNDLRGLVESEPSDARLAHAFQRGSLPTPLLGDLRALVEQVHTPLAVRSSSRLEDALQHPMAGVYATKMIPNNQLDADTRFQKLVEAIKFVYASTFFAAARSAAAAAGQSSRDEKMAVILQEVVGRRHGARFYPDISGVARSYNFYPTGPMRPEEGVLSLALGLGKTIVDGGVTWSCSPAHPRVVPPFGSPRDLLRGTQSQFWAVNMGEPPAYDPVAETEYLVQASIAEAEADGVLRWSASTYDQAADRLVTGIGRHGPRALTFAPILQQEQVPLVALVRALLAACEARLGGAVEIEFAMTLERGLPPAARFGFLQVRPMAVASELVEVPAASLADPDALVASPRVLGNGTLDGVCDIVHLRRDGFDPAATRDIAAQLEGLDRELRAARRPYLLIGFGRWGTTDERLGVPVVWGQIAGARAIVEAALPGLYAEPSQGSHFFHNVTSFRVFYFTVDEAAGGTIRWDRLEAQPAVRETRFLRHLALARPLRIEVDGRTGRGVVRMPAPGLEDDRP